MKEEFILSRHNSGSVLFSEDLKANACPAFGCSRSCLSGSFWHADVENGGSACKPVGFTALSGLEQFVYPRHF